MQPVAETLKAELKETQALLGKEEVEFLELQAQLADRREAVRRLQAAVDALEGRLQPAQSGSSAVEPPSDTREVAGSNPAPTTKQPSAPEPVNPLAHLKCKGCGTTGSLQQAILQSSGGMPISMLSCTDCGNQMPMGL